MKIQEAALINIPQLQVATKIEDNSSDFTKILSEQLDKLNDKQIDGENAKISLITGEATDIHQVMLTTEEAKLSLELAIQIRNKLVDAYQEISRINI